MDATYEMAYKMVELFGKIAPFWIFADAVVKYKFFKKVGVEPAFAFIPILSDYCMAFIAFPRDRDNNTYWVKRFMTLFILGFFFSQLSSWPLPLWPRLGLYMLLYAIYYMNLHLARIFNYGRLYALGLTIPLISIFFLSKIVFSDNPQRKIYKYWKEESTRLSIFPFLPPKDIRRDED